MEKQIDYSQHYSESAFWTLVRKAGDEIPFIRDALAMYYCLVDDATPAWVKAAIVGALGYLILPLDAIPDIMPVVGWLDDAGVISAAFAVVEAHVKPKHWKQADRRLAEPAS